jgi:hypothetical protein
MRRSLDANRASPSSRDADYAAFTPCHYTGFVMFFAFFAVQKPAKVIRHGKNQHPPRKENIDIVDNQRSSPLETAVPALACQTQDPLQTQLDLDTPFEGRHGWQLQTA